jgi:DNA-binding NtrC family response regulator
VSEGRFRDDLFYRLHVVPILVPPLRDRPEDIPLLAQHFVEKHAARSGRSIDGFEDGAIATLQAREWPGNVRELENTIERAMVLTTGSTITCEAVTIDAALNERAVDVPSLKLRQNVEWIERETIRRAIDRSMVKRQAAELMGISPRALSYYLAKYPLIDQHKAWGSDTTRSAVTRRLAQPHDAADAGRHTTPGPRLLTP